MPRKNNFLSFIANAAIFIILEIAALGLLVHNGELQNLWISRGLQATQAYFFGKIENIGRYFSLRKQNDMLALKNFRLEQELRRYRHLSGIQNQENPDSNIIGNFVYLPATIVKLSRNTQHNYMILDKGYEDGITNRSGVITDKGVIGIIDAVSRHYSYAIIFTNTDMHVSARVGHEGPIGPMEWDGISTNGGILREIPHHIPVENGDTVFTSGFSSMFPADIPIGIARDKKLVNGATYDIRTELFEDFSALKYVTVVKNLDTAEIELLEER